ncbi:PLC-like phosphodiesterase, partial [Rhodotorula toruloides]
DSSSPPTVWGSHPPSPPALEAPIQSHTRLTRLSRRAPDRATERQEGKVADEACAVEVGGRGVVGLREGRGSGAKSLSHGRTNNPWVTSRTRVGDEHLAHVAEAGSTMPPVLRTSALQSADLAGKPPNDAAASNETLATAPPSPPPSSPPTVSNRRSHGWCGTCFRAPGLRRRKKLKGEVDAGDDAQTLAEETVLRRDAERVKEGILHEDGQRGLLSALTKRRRKRPERIEQPRLLDSLGIARCSWMTALPGSVMLDELYIPGSHETLALHYPLLSSLCQTLPLASQLSFGIRFLDLRFNLTDKGELWAYHGLVPQRRRAEEVFEEIYEWLESAEGRGETVIISVKQENDTPPEVFASTLLSLIQSTAPLPSSPSNRTPASFWYTKNEWPRLGDVRGKAVLFCRFAWRGYGLHPVSWPNDQHVAWTTDIGGRESLVQDWVR